MDISEPSTGTNTIVRNHSLTVRLSDIEFIRVDERARAAGTSVSEYVRSVLLPDEQRQALDERVDSLEQFKARLEQTMKADAEVLKRLA